MKKHERSFTARSFLFKYYRRNFWIKKKVKKNKIPDLYDARKYLTFVRQCYGKRYYLV